VIIAEICQNHQGNEDLLFEMVDVAAECGANFIKIQSFFADDLGPEFRHDYDRLKKLELSWETQRAFAERCVLKGVIPMTTIYSTKYMEQIHNCGFKWVKIGSPNSHDTDLVSTLIATGFKVIISTGGRRNLKDLPRLGPLAGVLHCVSKYPHKPDEANLIRMLEIKKLWPSESYGFSDHTDPTAVFWDLPSKYALMLGATYVEKHFTILPRDQTKDGPVSIDPAQLMELCQFDRMTFQEKIKQCPEFGVIVCEQDQQEVELIKRFQGRWA
jgi:N,N'-diacetyllegionaminate synthase